MDRSVRSLAEVPPDEVVTVHRVLFECLQAHCDGLGLREGDRVSVGGELNSTRVLCKADGRLVRCPLELARFVEVRSDRGDRGQASR